MQRERRWPSSRTIYIGILAFIAILVAAAALLFPLYVQISQTRLQVGDVATQDILAPRAITYTSEIRTEQQRDAAARAVQPVYTPADPGVARTQLERLRNALSFIASVRADQHASLNQKIADLAALEEIHLDQEIAQNILALSDSRWQNVQQEAIIVLEQVMRVTIREDGLAEARRNVPSLVSLAFPEDQAAIVAELVAGFIAPNSFYSENLTTAARQQAREAVAPISHTYAAGETVVQRGQVIRDVDLEALEQLGLQQPQSSWKDLVGAVSLVILNSVFVTLYLHRKPHLLSDLRGLTLVVILFLAFLVIARLVVPGHAVLPYLYPLTAFSLTLATLFGLELALVFTLPLAILFTYQLPNPLNLTIYYLVGGIVGVLTLGAARRLVSFFWAGVAIGLTGAVVIVAYRLPQPETDWIAVLTLIGSAQINGIASAGLAVLLQFFLAQFLGLTTSLQLMELSRPDHPLLQFLLRNAPGSYQHSLQVANLAEQAAEQIGADPLLTRVGSLYHDAGKALNPFYFIENQVSDSVNPHDQLDPEASAAAIIRHVPDGLELARKYRLPGRIRDFIAEHHGTMVTRYQYVRAVEEAGGDESKVDIAKFTYPGPRPRSRETAILMLADGTEARMRAEQPKNEEELKDLIKSVIEYRVQTGELDETDLTLHDLDKIAGTFSSTLRGVYHPRIQYPKLDQLAAGKKVAIPLKGEETRPAVSRRAIHPAASDVPIHPRVDTAEKT